jgi:hypothetical protein
MNEVSTRTEKLFNWAILFGIFISLVALALYGYLGTFSRYGSDDYCLSAFYVREGDLLTKVIQRYNENSSRYTNILFIGLVDSLFGWYNVAILPPLMIALFVFGWYLFLYEIARTASLEWSRAFCFFLASLLLYFSLLQAPNLYETLYWRAGMTSHFVPPALMPYLFVFLLRQIGKSNGSIPARWVRILCFIFAFILGGFSEPPVALLVTILMLWIFALLWRLDLPSRRAALHVLAWALAGGLLALVTLAVAPANSIRLGNSAPGLVELVRKTIRYPMDFILYDLRSFPTPTLVSIFLPALLFFMQYSQRTYSRSNLRNTRIVLWIVLGTALAYLLIAASFAPSVYGQNFPIARARFAGRLILTGELIMIGAMLGILFANLRLKIIQFPSLQLVALTTLFLLSLYPLWTTRRMAEQIPVFEQRAQAWDERDALIRSMKADGVRDVIVPRLPTEVVQDLHNRTGFRLNRCASLLYDVDTILAIQTGE